MASMSLFVWKYQAGYIYQAPNGWSSRDGHHGTKKVQPSLMFLSFLLSIANHSRIMKNHDCILYILYIYISESSVVSAHVLGSLLMPLFSMNLPIQKKNMAALVTSTLHLPQANPKNKIPYTKLNSITENRKKNKQKNQDSRERLGGS